MARHSKPTNNLNDKEDSFKEKKISEEIMDSNKPNINHTLPNVPLFNGNAFESKSLDYEAKISKLISEIDILKKKVSKYYFY
jgi:hypothetical protein